MKNALVNGLKQKTLSECDVGCKLLDAVGEYCDAEARGDVDRDQISDAPILLPLRPIILGYWQPILPARASSLLPLYLLLQLLSYCYLT